MHQEAAASQRPLRAQVQERPEAQARQVREEGEEETGQATRGKSESAGVGRDRERGLARRQPQPQGHLRPDQLRRRGVAAERGLRRAGRDRLCLRQRARRKSRRRPRDQPAHRRRRLLSGSQLQPRRLVDLQRRSTATAPPQYSTSSASAFRSWTRTISARSPGSPLPRRPIASTSLTSARAKGPPATPGPATARSTGTATRRRSCCRRSSRRSIPHPWHSTSTATAS